MEFYSRQGKCGEQYREQKYEENWADLLYASGHDTGRRTGYDGYVSRGQSPCSYSFLLWHFTYIHKQEVCGATLHSIQ
jgi:hypothetical protein